MAPKKQKRRGVQRAAEPREDPRASPKSKPSAGPKSATKSSASGAVATPRKAKKSKTTARATALKPPRPSERGEPSIRPVRWISAEGGASQRPEAWHEDWEVTRDELELEADLLLAEPEPMADDADDEGAERDEDSDEEEVAVEEAPPLVGVERRGRRRSKTIARKQMVREQRRLVAEGGLPVIDAYDRPVSRTICREAERPCLFVSCRYHLYLDVNPTTGSIKLNFPDKEVWELDHSCALDIAERGGITLEEVGDIMNLTRERIRQVEANGLEKLRTGHAALETFIDGRELPAQAVLAAGARPDAGPRGLVPATRGLDAGPRGLDAGPRGLDAGPRSLDDDALPDDIEEEDDD